MVGGGVGGDEGTIGCGDSNNLTRTIKTVWCSPNDVNHTGQIHQRQKGEKKIIRGTLSNVLKIKCFKKKIKKNQLLQ